MALSALEKKVLLSHFHFPISAPSSTPYAEKKKLSENVLRSVCLNPVRLFIFRWLKDTFKIGIKRELEEHEIYEVTNSLRSDKNTEEFVTLWDEELKKPSPSILRLMFKLHGCGILFWGLMFSFFETFAR